MVMSRAAFHLPARNRRRWLVGLGIGVAVIGGALLVIRLHHSITIPATDQRPTSAAGRPVPVKVVDAVSGRPLANATVAVGNATLTTDSNGQVALKRPTATTMQDATVNAAGHVRRTITITASEQLVPASTVALTPAGTIYFLSNASGTIDVVASNLDGTGRSVIVAGTGNEGPSTRLLTSPDLRYLALVTRRGAGTGSDSLYLIDTANENKLLQVDGTTANYFLTGWMGDRLVYTLSRTDVQYWQRGATAIKVVDAQSGTVVPIDQSATTPNANQFDYGVSRFDGPYLLKDELVYGTTWSATYQPYLAGQSITVTAVKPDGTSRKVLEQFPIATTNRYPFISYKLSGGGAILLKLQTSAIDTVYASYRNGVLNAAAKADFDAAKTSYTLSPSTNSTAWLEDRDGSSAVMIGDGDGLNGKTIGTLKDYSLVSWYGDNDLMLSKANSELYLLSINGLGTPWKVTAYYSPGK